MSPRIQKNTVTEIQKYIIDTTPYNQEVYLLVHSSGRKVCEHINNDYENVDKIEEDDKCRGFEWKTHYLTDGYEKGRFYLYIHTDNLTNSTIEHEAIHLTWDILDHVGVQITNDNHEAFTYFYEHILKQIRENLGIKIVKE